jgi:hypothetical protein
MCYSIAYDIYVIDDMILMFKKQLNISVIWYWYSILRELNTDNLNCSDVSR